MAQLTDEASLFAGLARDRGQLTRTSTAERVAAILRERITEGSLPPGTRLSEELLGQALGVSRNTLREAFRLLSKERLLVHELNRGVFVRKLTLDDLVDVYRVRRLVEVAVVRSAGPLDDDQLRRLRANVAAGEQAVAEGRWIDVGTANIHFHLSLVALSASPRVDELMHQVLAELRLVFHVMTDPRAFHAPFVSRNRALIALLEAGDFEQAARDLEVYLTDAEAELVTVMATP